MPELPPNSEQLDLVEGQVERVTFENDTTGFRVLKIVSAKGLGAVSVVGRMQRVSVGARVRASGRFENDPRHGRQLRAHTVVVLNPDTLEGLVKYLGSGLAPGIGPALAKRIVAHFRADTLDVLDNHPERVLEVAGIGRRKVDALVQAWAEQRAAREIMVFLQGHGVSQTMAMRVFRMYGKDAVRIVSENPYRLAADIWGVGFRKADEIARQLGLALDSPERVTAGILHLIEQYAERGHVFSPRAELANAAEQMLGVDVGIVEQAIEHLALNGNAHVEELSHVGHVVYSVRRHADEVGVAASLARLVGAKRGALAGAEEAIAAFERATSTVLAPAQRQAVHDATTASVLVVTGGPGVGKTTLVRALLELYERAHLDVKLAAPTGRASRRISDSTGRDALTIHRLLEFDPRSHAFNRNDRHPLSLDALIVDESSMLDMSLAHALLQALPAHARLVLVGDVDQLPSIGAGAVLRDVIESQTVPCVRLTEIFRQAKGSLIICNAHRIRDGRYPESSPPGDKLGDFYIAYSRETQEAADKVLRLVVERIPKQFGLHPSADVQVLAPMYKGACGCDSLNERLQAAINPNGTSITIGTRTFRIGDKVMQLRNDYARDVYNGDVGFVRAYDPNDGRMIVELEGKDVVYDATQVDELTLSYACSVHKSQGSEYPAVVVPLLSSHYVMLSRNLLYTAVTRGKRLVVLVTDRKALEWTLAEMRREERNSYMGFRLRKLITEC